MRVSIEAGLTIGVLAQVVDVIEVLGTSLLLLSPRILRVFIVIIRLEITILLFCLLILSRSCATKS